MENQGNGFILISQSLYMYIQSRDTLNELMKILETDINSPIVKMKLHQD